MPVIKVWCLPKSPEKNLRQLHKAIVEAVCAIKMLGLRDQQDMTVLFPPDSMSYGLGSEIIVEITGLFEKKERTHEVVQMLAFSVGRAVQQLFPKTQNVECFVYQFKQDVGGFWTSRGPSTLPIESITIKEMFSTIPRTSIRTRTVERLRGEDIMTIGQLLQHPKEKLLRMRGFGPKCLNDLEQLLKERYGLTLKSGMDLS